MESTAAAPPTHRDLVSPLLLAVLLAGTVVFLWFAPAADEIYMALHVTGAVVWVGGATLLTILALMTQRARDTHALVSLVGQIEKLALRVFNPASLVTLGFGVALVEKDNSGYGSFWIDFGLAVWGFSFVLGAGVIGPHTARLRRLIAEHGADDPRSEKALAKLLLLARVDATMLLLVVIDMAAKPSF